MEFDDETIDVLIGGYMSRDAAHDDYEAVRQSGGYLHGAVVVSKDVDGAMAVEQTDHMVREGAAGLGAGGLLHHRTKNQLEKQASETIPLGGAGLIVAYPHSAAGKVEPAVKRAVQKVVGEAEGHHVRTLKSALSDAQQKMRTDSS